MDPAEELNRQVDVMIAQMQKQQTASQIAAACAAPRLSFRALKLSSATYIYHEARNRIGSKQHVGS
jgi:hypothetical protein